MTSTCYCLDIISATSVEKNYLRILTIQPSKVIMEANTRISGHLEGIGTSQIHVLRSSQLVLKMTYSIRGAIPTLIWRKNPLKF